MAKRRAVPAFGTGIIQAEAAFCCWPDCIEPTGRLAVPLCDRHTVIVWRAVHAEMDIRVDRDYSKPSPSGTIYCIRLADRVKIGWTSSLARRLGELPHDEVLGTTPGTMLDEAALHRAFASVRIGGEWFRDDPAIRRLVAGWASCRTS